MTRNTLWPTGRRRAARLILAPVGHIDRRADALQIGEVRSLSFNGTTHSTTAVADFRLAGSARNSSLKSRCRIAVEFAGDDTLEDDSACVRRYVAFDLHSNLRRSGASPSTSNEQFNHITSMMWLTTSSFINEIIVAESCP